MAKPDLFSSFQWSWSFSGHLHALCSHLRFIDTSTFLPPPGVKSFFATFRFFFFFFECLAMHLLTRFCSASGCCVGIYSTSKYLLSTWYDFSVPIMGNTCCSKLTKHWGHLVSQGTQKLWSPGWKSWACCVSSGHKRVTSVSGWDTEWRDNTSVLTTQEWQRAGQQIQLQQQQCRFNA